MHSIFVTATGLLVGRVDCLGRVDWVATGLLFRHIHWVPTGLLLGHVGIQLAEGAGVGGVEGGFELLRIFDLQSRDAIWYLISY